MFSHAKPSDRTERLDTVGTTGRFEQSFQSLRPYHARARQLDQKEHGYEKWMCFTWGVSRHGATLSCSTDSHSTFQIVFPENAQHTLSHTRPVRFRSVPWKTIFRIPGANGADHAAGKMKPFATWSPDSSEVMKLNAEYERRTNIGLCNFQPHSVTPLPGRR